MASAWKPGDPIHPRGIDRPIAETRDDHWCGDSCMGHGPAAARWPEPFPIQDLEVSR